jgi:hypothetical protein
MKIQAIEKSEEPVAHDFQRPEDSETKGCADAAQHFTHKPKGT